MADEQPIDPALAQAARHALHDEELVAAFAAAPDDADDPARARSLIERCATCASLAADIAAITGAVRGLGPAAAAASATIRAPRDFRLTAADVARLGPAPAARPATPPAIEPARPAFGFFAGLAALLRPVGATLATFGLVGLLVGTVSLGSLGSAALAPGQDMGVQAPAETPGVGGATGHQPGPTQDTREAYTPLATGVGAPDDHDSEALTAAAVPPPTLLLLVGSALALLLGVVLFAAGARVLRSGRSPSRP